MSWLRDKPCPLCGSSTGFSANQETGGYFCHRCQEKGHISKLNIDLGRDFKPEFKSYDKRFDKPKPEINVSQVWGGLYRSQVGGLTDKYLMSRNITSKSWIDLDLREGRIFGREIMACYTFRDLHGDIKALHYVRFTDGIKEKRYLGKKSEGVALLQPQGSKIIIAEGLENALIVRDRLHPTYGVCVGGDAGNIKNYATRHSVQLSGYTFFQVEDSDAVGERAARIFRETLRTVGIFRTMPGQDAVDSFAGITQK